MISYQNLRAKRYRESFEKWRHLNFADDIILLEIYLNKIKHKLGEFLKYSLQIKPVIEAILIKKPEFNWERLRCLMFKNLHYKVKREMEEKHENDIKRFDDFTRIGLGLDKKYFLQSGFMTETFISFMWNCQNNKENKILKKNKKKYEREFAKKRANFNNVHSMFACLRRKSMRQLECGKFLNYTYKVKPIVIGLMEDFGMDWQIILKALIDNCNPILQHKLNQKQSNIKTFDDFVDIGLKEDYESAIIQNCKPVEYWEKHWEMENL